MEKTDGLKSTATNSGVNNNIDGLVQKEPNQQMSDRTASARANREERLRLLKDRQNEERLRKLEELKEHALQAAKLREEQDLRRRKHFEELGKKDDDRRRQAEEKRRILDEERRVNLQSKWDTKEKLIQAARQNEKKPIYAFGSCTPRLVENNVDGCLWKSTYNLNMPRETTLKSTSAHDLHSQSLMSSSLKSWNQQRTTFTLAGSADPAGRRGNKDRLELRFRNTQLEPDRVFCGRRRTDLTPTLPTRRDDFSSRSASRADSGRGSRSGNVTPSLPPSMTSSLMTSSTHSQVQMRPRYLAPRRLRPASVHVTGVSGNSNSPRSGESTPQSEKPQQHRIEKLAVKTERPQKAPSPKVESASRPIKTSAPLTSRKSEPESKVKPEVIVAKKQAKPISEKSPGDTTTIRRAKPKAKENEQSKPKKPTEASPLVVEKPTESEGNQIQKVQNVEETLIDIKNLDLSQNEQIQQVDESKTNDIKVEHVPEQTNKGVDLLVDQNESLKTKSNDEGNVMAEIVTQEESTGATTNETEESAETKARIMTEDEAKAAIAEKRRLTREAQEREVQRLEEEKRLEEERQRLEAEEAERFAEEARRLEEERLKKAIEEQERREEEERRKREEEERARQEREREDREAAREAERIRLEMEERLKREEEERLERKRRVEAIMSRTRKKDVETTNENKSAIVQEDESTNEKSSVNGIIHETIKVESNQSNATSNGNLNNFNNNVEFSDTLIDFGDIIQNSGNPDSTHSNNAGSNSIISNPLQDLLS